MNERIQKLYEQAYCDIKDEFGYWVGRHFDKEKFAELIVRECADVAQKHNQSSNASIYAVGYVVKQHFGV